MVLKYLCLATSFALASASAGPFSVKPAQSNNDLKTKYMSDLISNAKPLSRKLDDGIDMTPYSVQFQKCQFMQEPSNYYDDDGNDDGADTMFQTKKYIIFRLCSNCKKCNSNYGEYLVDMDTYLSYTIEYFSTYQSDYCTACQNLGCNDDDGNGRRDLRFDDMTCDCESFCSKVTNMKSKGYLEASDYVSCQKLYGGKNSDGDYVKYYAGAVCDADGDKITIGVFADQYCTRQESDVDIRDYLFDGRGRNVRLSHALLKKVYTDSCISCVNDYGDDDDAGNDDYSVQAMCENIYAASAKCESPNGFAGYVDQYSNQATQEDLVCKYISNVKSGMFSQDGEITLETNIRRKRTSRVLSFILTILILGTVGLCIFAASIRSKIISKFGKSELMSSKEGTLV
mmetsp:Transcript_13977/g.20429  ORF Transcript_13977/g.20429 Transcript_13977/m.20429 type:complete len:399 (-) Transcript_13977:305-1501(-)|eukprot:CAMPEP_0195527068 /NCGR_PEP_ID=MMETSP0794_2-20130614/28512_1 /TAXON_ID=515487 /ORGANISM="Stephanopyxis turris, Strain CCMP 815" /LENGTH=398 /DNA_ID=CAMNT_0040657893 /DNA_START=59 /DNA_END=1255 /DNA_ORIENTATION=+